jgi:hypothetical protein
MGGITVQANTGAYYPGFKHFVNSDSKWLLGVLISPSMLTIFADVLQIDLNPLRKLLVVELASDNEYQIWEEYTASLWQTPSTVRICIEIFIAALETAPNVYANLEQERQRRNISFRTVSGFTDARMIEWLQHELRSLLYVVTLAEQEGAQMIRLTGT